MSREIRAPTCLNSSIRLASCDPAQFRQVLAQGLGQVIHGHEGLGAGLAQCLRPGQPTADAAARIDDQPGQPGIRRGLDEFGASPQGAGQTDQAQGILAHAPDASFGQALTEAQHIGRTGPDLHGRRHGGRDDDTEQIGIVVNEQVQFRLGLAVLLIPPVRDIAGCPHAAPPLNVLLPPTPRGKAARPRRHASKDDIRTAVPEAGIPRWAPTAEGWPPRRNIYFYQYCQLFGCRTSMGQDGEILAYNRPSSRGIPP